MSADTELDLELEDFPFEDFMQFLEDNINISGSIYRGRLVNYDDRFGLSDQFTDKVLNILKELDLIISHGIIRDFGNRKSFDRISIVLAEKT